MGDRKDYVNQLEEIQEHAMHDISSRIMILKEIKDFIHWHEQAEHGDWRDGNFHTWVGCLDNEIKQLVWFMRCYSDFIDDEVLNEGNNNE